MKTNRINGLSNFPIVLACAGAGIWYLDGVRDRSIAITFDAELCLVETLTAGMKRHLYRVIKRRIRRIAKYTNACEVNVALSRTHKRAYLVIRDNGQALAVDQNWTSLFILDIVDRTVIATTPHGSGTTMKADSPVL